MHALVRVVGEGRMGDGCVDEGRAGGGHANERHPGGDRADETRSAGGHAELHTWRRKIHPDCHICK